MNPKKKNLKEKLNGFLSKKQGVESKIILTKGCRLIVWCQVQNADLIAVSLACPKDPKNLLEKVVRALCSAEIS